MLTNTPNELMAGIHDRVPVLIANEGQAVWLQPDVEVGRLHALLQPCPSDDLEAYPVSDAVNAVANYDPSLLKPVALQPALPLAEVV